MWFTKFKLNQLNHIRYTFCLCCKPFENLELLFFGKIFFNQSRHQFIYLFFYDSSLYFSMYLLHGYTRNEHSIICSSGIPMRHPKWLIETFKTMTFWFQNALALLVRFYITFSLLFDSILFRDKCKRPFIFYVKSRDTQRDKRYEICQKISTTLYVVICKKEKKMFIELTIYVSSLVKV